MGGIDYPDLLPCLLHPFVCIAAVRAFLALAGFVQVIDGITAEVVRSTVHVDVAILAGKGASGKVGGIACIHSAAIAIGCIHLPLFADDGLVGITLVSLHIALACQKQQRYGRSLYGYGIFSAIDFHLGGADTGGNESVVGQRNHRGIADGILLHTVTHLIRCGRTGIVVIVG